MITINDTPVGKTGYGLMGLTWRPHQTPDEQAFPTMKKAIEKGAVFWNSAEFYGTPEPTLGLQLLHRYFKKYPEDASKVILSIKGCVNVATLTPLGSAADVRKSVENTLRILDGVKKVDIFQCARVDPRTPIEESIGALAEFVKEGQIGGIGLSEAGAVTIRRAHAVHPIAAVEIEYSLWATEIRTNSVASVCEELNIPIVAYSPLGRGFLTGQIKSLHDLPEDDYRRHFSRFKPANFKVNIELVNKVEGLAKKKGCSPAQLAMEWVRYQSGKDGMPELLPIPGATMVERVEENCQEVGLADEEYRELEDIIGSTKILGGRYFEAAEAHLFV
ncbi:Aldo/keto reductase [Choiromyces venosus 120613-1]|uniref:Aldo/keto reductase n=1 Tax=Choiromyces venosus 120613-1 TaxID=1336337 RepID=A0A3N4JAL8_9PEZI|nr:Aldo/keto reductase [Choiromyces venosus 120613-1]